MHIYSILLIAMCLDGSVDMATGYEHALEVRFPTRTKDFVHVTEPLPALGRTQSAISQSQSQSYFTTDGQSVSISWCRAPLWGP
jgi:hypothetical protein